MTYKMKSKLLTIFGDPVSHSISPILHNFTIKELSLNGCYTRYHLSDGDKLREVFFSCGFDSANITVPHKEAAFKACDEVVGIAKKIKAVNTIVKKDQKLIGYNTDAPGFFESIKEFQGIKKALLLGAGGTAKAIAHILKENSIKPTILNRSKNRLTYFKDNGFLAYSWEEFRVDRYDIIINTTSAGLSNDALPLKRELLRELISHSNYCIDVIYNKLTPFLKLSKELNKPYKDGSDMLLYQAVLAFIEFFEHKANKNSIKKAMQEAMFL